MFISGLLPFWFVCFLGWVDPPSVEQGRAITDQVGKNLLQTVLREVGKGGTKGGIAFCQVEALPITDSLARRFGVQIQRVAQRNRNPQNELSAAHQAIWASFEGEELQEIFEEKADSYVYFRPIKMQATCQMCHGTTMEADVRADIQRRYPTDRATDFEVGDLRGMWIVRWNK